MRSPTRHNKRPEGEHGLAAPSPTASFITIRYQHRVAVLAGHTRVWPLGWLCELSPGHPTRRLVFYMCHYVRLVLEDQVPGPYTDEQDRRFARLALLSDQPDDLQPRPGEDDQDVAARASGSRSPNASPPARTSPRWAAHRDHRRLDTPSPRWPPS